MWCEWFEVHCCVVVYLKDAVTSFVVFHSCLAGASTKEGWIQREDDCGGHLWGRQTLSEGSTSRGQQAVHSLHRCTTSERRGVWPDAGKHRCIPTGGPYRHKYFSKSKPTAPNMHRDIKQICTVKMHRCTTSWLDCKRAKKLGTNIHSQVCNPPTDLTKQRVFILEETAQVLTFRLSRLCACIWNKNRTLCLWSRPFPC